MKLKKFIQQNFFLLVLIGVALINLFVSVRLNVFRYNNFDQGKFDLGNMTQMVWNTLNGRFMYLTDYFGVNMPRWGMSHVDPILVLFVPIFAVFQHPLTLVFSQIVLVLGSSILVYLIAKQELESDFVAGVFGISFLFYPAIGYINAITGFHGVSAAIPFFLAAFYVFEKMYKSKNFTKKGLITFAILLVINMSGKEQIPMYVFMYGVYILFFRNDSSVVEKTKKIGLSMMVISALWFAAAFFVIIPAFADKRVEGYQKFAEDIGIVDANTRDVALPNYFLSRYDAFGDSYFDVVKGVIFDHQLAIRVFFGGDKLDNLDRTLRPVMYLPLLNPFTFMMALPDIGINYLTSAGGIGTAEIENHRISMIIPVLFISSIFAVSYVSRYIKKAKYVLPVIMLGLTIQTTFAYNNPVYLWLNQAIKKRVFAKSDTEIINEDLEIGDVVKLSELDNKDISCANMVVKTIPDTAIVSGPDYLGAHLSMRETYAIFPALYKDADYLVVDVFSQKLLRILDLETDLIRDIVGEVLNDPNYKLTNGCGNLFVFERVGEHGKSTKLPIQEFYVYDEQVDYEIYNSLTVVDYTLPLEVKKNNPTLGEITYTKRENKPLDDFVIYMTYVNKENGKIYQAANLPSFAVEELSGWDKDRYYQEEFEIAIPEYVESGEYMAFIGMSNKIKIRNVYLGDLVIE